MVLANHVSRNSVFAAFILLPTRFWPRIDRELPFLAVAQNYSNLLFSIYFEAQKRLDVLSFFQPVGCYVWQITDQFHCNNATFFWSLGTSGLFYAGGSDNDYGFIALLLLYIRPSLLSVCYLRKGRVPRKV